MSRGRALARRLLTPSSSPADSPGQRSLHAGSPGGGGCASCVPWDSSTWPEGSHDPRTRRLLFQIEAWDIRVHPLRAPAQLASLSIPEELDLQMWHPERRVSLLAPSASIGAAYELLCVGGLRLRLRDHHSAASALAQELGILLPTTHTLRLAFQRRGLSGDRCPVPGVSGPCTRQT